MKRLKYPSKTILKKLFNYNNGVLEWRNMKNKKKKIAGFISDKNRHRIEIDNVSYYRSILIWIYHYGNFNSKLQVDHIDLNKNNDKIENLRLVTATNNGRNKRTRSNTGFSLISLMKSNLYLVTIVNNFRKQEIKYFKRLKNALIYRNRKLSDLGLLEYYKNSDIYKKVVADE